MSTADLRARLRCTSDRHDIERHWVAEPFTDNSSLVLERVMASVALVLMGLRSQWHLGLTTGYLAALVLLPLTLPSLGRYSWSKLLLVMPGLCLACGLLVASWTRNSHIVSGTARTHAVGLLVGVTVSVVLVLWARLLMTPRAIAVLFGLGACLGAGSGLSGFAETWKFGLAIPCTLLMLGMTTDRAHNAKTDLIALGALAGITLFADARSLFAAYIVTAGLTFWASQSVRGSSRRRNLAMATGGVVVVLIVVYEFAQILISHGVLGQEARERSMADAATTGSILLGGRPELSATYALMRDQPWGYGVGVIPNTHDVAVGNSALVDVGLQPTKDGFSTYMFGRQQFELHSIFGDLWATYGLIGLIAAILILFLAIHTMSPAPIVSGGRPSALLLFLATYTVWNIVSSPLWSAEPTLILFLGLALQVRKPRGPAISTASTMDDDGL